MAYRQDNAVEKLEFNLSQFQKHTDLLVAFQTVRDQALSGKILMVLSNEFDTPLERKWGWLQYFLAPMQDGQFSEHGHRRPLGDNAKNAKEPNFIRRAILLRPKLEERQRKNSEGQLDVDPVVLNALLRVPQFRHSARSL
ncbi:hypothetical protein BBP40_009051 [Aspergillus hancockii]|nr:hypothetical protein BBP40_009051 [Aspergillus hancockii]